MKFFLKKAVFVNKAPFDNLSLDFVENEVAVLTAINGRGKTTILSHIVDAFYELARPHYPQEFSSKTDQFYRVSSSLYSLDINKPSFVYFRFKFGDDHLDYVEIRNNCTQQQYDEAIQLADKITFETFSKQLTNDGYIKHTEKQFNKQKAIDLFSSNIVTYFPSYRYEVPGYLNDAY